MNRWLLANLRFADLKKYFPGSFVIESQRVIVVSHFRISAKKGESMFKKYLTTVLAVLVLNLAFGATAFAGTDGEKEAKFAEKVKADVAKLGTGKDARVEVKLKDGTKLKG